MNDSLPQLEAQKNDLLASLRPPVISGARPSPRPKPNCHCAKRGDPGHGPNFRLTRRVAGKTTTETLIPRRRCARRSNHAAGPCLRRAQEDRRP